MKLLYIAGPFTAPTRLDVEANVAYAAMAASRIVAACPGVYPVVPHALGVHLLRVGTPEYHYAGTLALMEACAGVLLLPGWEESVGSAAEERRARELGMQVFLPGEHLDLQAIAAWGQEPPAPSDQDDAELRRLVERMREAQRSYFRTRSQAALRESKHLEAQVDEILAPPRQVVQRPLFGGGK